MEATAFIVFMCSVLALSSACCTPDQWEGEEAAIGGYATFWHHGLIREFIAVSYDAVNNRSAAVLDYQNGVYSNKYKIVTRYDTDPNIGKLYILNLKTNHCCKKTLRGPFRRACIPADAKSRGSYFLGLSGGFNVTGYEVNSRKIQAFVSVQELDNGECVPVGESVYGKLGKVDFVQNIGFLNVTPGIKNETVFDVPEKCEEKDDFSLANELTREHYIMAI